MNYNGSQSEQNSTVWGVGKIFFGRGEEDGKRKEGNEERGRNGAIRTKWKVGGEGGSK